MENIKKFLVQRQAILMVVVSFVGLYLISTGISLAAFTFLIKEPTASLNVTSSRSRIDPSLPKTEECPLNGAKFTRRKEKEAARHTFNITWSPEASVKGQFKNERNKPNLKADAHDNAIVKPKDASLSIIKRDIVRSLIIASLILALETVLYLASK